jgi:N-methylhydantoinase A/oxoprolinase/acetone carboxylase beta subunit
VPAIDLAEVGAGGIDDVVSFDMGGTTAKASLIEKGMYSRAVEYSVGAGIMVGSRLLTGAGYRLKVPAIDLAEVGAGGIDDVVSFDMGGTTAKASLIEKGMYSRAVEYSVGAGIMVGSRLLTGAGYRLKVPAIDLAEVGAGGGSIIWLDAGGAMQIGPRSAGANPGPVCYGLGGSEPTVTDANVVLGYLNPDYLVGGELKIDSELSHSVLSHVVATPNDLTQSQS